MKQQYVLIIANVLLIHIDNGRYMICCNIDMMNLFNHFFIDSHCSLYFTFHRLGKCYNKNLHTNILCYSSLCSLAVVSEHSKNLTSLPQEFVSSSHHCLVQVRLLLWVCLQSWFWGSILWFPYLRFLRFQQSTRERAWKTRKGLWQRLDVC